MTKTTRLLTLFLFISTCLLLGCSNKKDISLKPKSTQIKGDLGDYFEVVDKEYKIPIAKNYLEQLISVEVKRKDKDFPFDSDKINPFGTNGEEQYHVGFGIELLGDNGLIQVNSATEGGLSGTYSSEDITSLFKLKKGESGYIRWTVNKTEDIKTFQLTSALKKESGTSTSATNSERNFKGNINNSYPIEMSLNFENTNISGTYFYTKQKSNIDLKGSANENGNLILKEYDKNGALTGTFNGKLVGSNYSGNWTNSNETKNYPFSVSEISTSSTLSMESKVEDVVENNNTATNWDKMLDDYDNYVTEYIKFYKKAQKGDNSAITEYSSMMEKAVSLQSSLKNAQNDKSLSGTQAARMLKIQAKMLEGIQVK